MKCPPIVIDCPTCLHPVEVHLKLRTSEVQDRPGSLLVDLIPEYTHHCPSPADMPESIAA